MWTLGKKLADIQRGDKSEEGLVESGTRAFALETLTVAPCAPRPVVESIRKLGVRVKGHPPSGCLNSEASPILTPTL